MSLDKINLVANNIKITPKIIKELNNLSLPNIKIPDEINNKYQKIINNEIKELNKIFKLFIKQYKTYIKDENLTFEILKSREEIYNKINVIKFLKIDLYKQFNEEVYKILLKNLHQDKLLKSSTYEQYLTLFNTKTFLEIDKMKFKNQEECLELLENSSLAFELWYKNIYHSKALKTNLDKLLKTTFIDEFPNSDFEDFYDFYEYTISLILNGANVDKQEICLLKTSLNLKKELWVDENGDLF